MCPVPSDARLSRVEPGFHSRSVEDQDGEHPERGAERKSHAVQGGGDQAKGPVFSFAQPFCGKIGQDCEGETCSVRVLRLSALVFGQTHADEIKHANQRHGGHDPGGFMFHRVDELHQIHALTFLQRFHLLG